MAIGVQSDFVIFQEELQTGFIETLEQFSEAFNEASLGAITLGVNLTQGDYEREAFFASIANLATRRDITANPATPVGDTPLTEAEQVLVKLNRKIGPVANTRNMFRKIMRDPGEFSLIVGQMAAKSVQVEMVNTALRCAVAALSGTAALVHNVTAASPTDTISTDNLVQTLAKAGDSAGGVVLWVMHSQAYYTLVRAQLATHSFDSVAGFNIATGQAVTLGRPVLVTDSSSLWSNTSPTDPTRILGLRQGAIRLEESELGDLVLDDITGGDQLAIRMQGEYAFNVGVRGYKWDMGNGGVNPSNTALATSSNWDAAMTDTRSYAGVMLIADPT